MKQTILVTGGAGYIGSHTVLELLHHNYAVVVIDKQCSDQILHPDVFYFQCDIADTKNVRAICMRYRITAVVHCAAYIEVGASVVNPADYYDNNVIKTVIFLNTLQKCNIKNIIFSSSAAVYGVPQTNQPITEESPCAPINPYGRTKLMIEQILHDYHTAYNVNYIALRYFNAAGAYPEYNLGERHKPETHLIPRIIQAALENKQFTLFGNDYATPDGTCIRDYLHVRDIARAHRLAIEYSAHNSCGMAINLGTAHGYSVQEIITTTEQIIQRKITISNSARRAGDPAYLVADASRAHALLQWQPLHSDIIHLISSAYAFTTQNSIDAQQRELVPFNSEISL